MAALCQLLRPVRLHPPMLDKCPICGKLWKSSSFNIHFGRCKASRSGSGPEKRRRPLLEKGPRPTKLPRRENSSERQENGETVDQVSTAFARGEAVLNGPLQLPEDPEFVVGSSGGVLELEQPDPALLHSPIPVSVSRSGRVRRPPRALQDFLPSSTGGLPAHILTHFQPAQPTPSSPQPAAAEPAYTHSQGSSHARTLSPVPTEVVATEANHFGVFRQYPVAPRREPAEETSLYELCDHTFIQRARRKPPGTAVRGFGRVIAERIRLQALSPTHPPPTAPVQPWYFPFLNPTSFLLMEWQYTGANLKSNGEIQRLVDEVILCDQFNPRDLRGFDVSRETARLDNTDALDGWHRASLSIPVPKAKVKYPSEQDAPHFVIEDVYHRRLLDVIKEAAADEDTTTYNWIPYELNWNRPLDDGSRDPQGCPITEPVRLYSDVVNSQEALDEYARIRDWAKQHCNDPPEVEIGLVPILIWSDSTQLANFGNASMWPIYVFFGFVSKYIRARPNSLSAHHLAYVPKVRPTH